MARRNEKGPFMIALYPAADARCNTLMGRRSSQKDLPPDRVRMDGPDVLWIKGENPRERPNFHRTRLTTAKRIENRAGRMNRVRHALDCSPAWHKPSAD